MIMRMHAYILSGRHCVCVHAHVRGMAASQSTIDTMTDHKYRQSTWRIESDTKAQYPENKLRSVSINSYVSACAPRSTRSPLAPMHARFRLRHATPEKKNLCTRVVQRCLSSTTQLPSICSWIELGCAQNGFSTGPCCPRTMVSQLHGRISHGRTTDNSDHDESTSDKGCLVPPKIFSLRQIEYLDTCMEY
jgi:hypothetical protein